MSDSFERKQALNPDGSFLVQAPAGSGKTALLTQRFLRLLATVDEPEQILAITFTRKAAAEMRLRVLAQLRKACGPRPEDAFEQQGWDLAAAALQRDQQKGWGILASPRRLRVQTLDSFQNSLVKRLPWLSRWGVGEGVTENALPMYADAVRQALRAMAEDDSDSKDDLRALINLLKLRDNKLEGLSHLIVELVARREEWLTALGPHVFAQMDGDTLRHQLEGNLCRVVESKLQKVQNQLPPWLSSELLPLARFAANNLEPDNADALVLRDIEAWPESDPACLPIWLALSNLLLTGKGVVRKTVNVGQGFPAGDKAAKAQMVAVLDSLRDEDQVVEALASLSALPETQYTDEQWTVIQAVFRLMRRLLPALQVQFAAHRESDFVEITLRAASALEEAPGVSTVLAERLDAQIQHILVDEFQDTSMLQMEIIRKLTENWTPGDGRSLFLVGDPMQSIYGWRNARVDLFLRAGRNELRGLPDLEFLQLRRNFRSKPRLIAECNAIFQALFPKEDDASIGAVVHATADAGRPESDTDTDAQSARIHYHPFLSLGPQEEAAWIADEIVRVRNEAMSIGGAAPRFGILFRKGASAAPVAEAMRARGLRYQAVDIENLVDLPVITDLHSLLHALLSTRNRLAWWSILRAPWCGLRLQELEMLHHVSNNASVWEAIQALCHTQPGHVSMSTSRFDDEAVRRVQRLQVAFEQALHWRGRRPIAHLLRALFLNTGASRCHADARSQLAAEEFFRLLSKADEAALLANPTVIDAELQRLKAPSDPNADDSVQMLTIHKAKGLEFDVVFVPYLNASPPPPRVGALSWDEIPIETASPHEEPTAMLILPGRATSDAPSRLGRFLAARRSKREQQERLRVMYVAFTRAKKHLHLLATIDPGDAATVDELKVRRQSYLKDLWPQFEAPFQRALEEMANAPLFQEHVALDVTPTRYPPLRRLSLAALPEPFVSESADHTMVAMAEGQFYRPGGSWETAESASGTVFHRLMELVSGDASTYARLRDRRGVPAAWRTLIEEELLRLLPLESNIPFLADRIVAAVQRTSTSTLAQWVFAPTHQRVLVEQGISYTVKDTQREVRLDRAFQDAAGDWHIVDFKLVQEDLDDAGADTLEQFRQQQKQRYQQHMEQYARLLQRIHAEPVMLTLYFPLQDVAVQWLVPLMHETAIT